MYASRYDAIGTEYIATRREDPRIAAQIRTALGDARSLVNVGAGAGAYEPHDRRVIPIEPSEVMIAQRDPGAAPAVRAAAWPLPLRDQSVDAAMAILSLDHWDDDQERGVKEMRRVARGPVVILTVDPKVSEQMWLIADYLPEVAELDRRTFPTLEMLRRWLDASVAVQELLIHRQTPDWMLASFWAHPERVLDPQARNSTSGFARMPPRIVNRVVDAVERDLKNGIWEARHGSLRALDEYDAGLRLVVSTPGRPPDDSRS